MTDHFVTISLLPLVNLSFFVTVAKKKRNCIGTIRRRELKIMLNREIVSRNKINDIEIWNIYTNKEK